MSTLTQTQVAAAMDEWLTTVGLTVSESAAINVLKSAVAQSMEEFRICATTLAGLMPKVTRNAVTKAREQGKCQEWPHV